VENLRVIPTKDAMIKLGQKITAISLSLTDYILLRNRQGGDGKGVAFLTCEKEENDKYHTLVRLWKITEEQFDCIWEQEGKTYYHIKLYLREKDGLEIYTLTGCWLKEKNRPSEKYLHYIKLGLRETTGWTDEEIEKYISKFLGDVNV